MVKRWGPTRGPGVSMTEMQSAGVIQQGALGTKVMIGEPERGTPGELLACLTEGVSRQKIGSRYNGLHLPHAVDGYFYEAEQKGMLYVVPVRHGDEIKSWLMLKNRMSTPGNAVKLIALNGGRWAGKKRTMTCTVNGSPGYTGTTIAFTGGSGDVSDLGARANVWKGATVTDDTSPTGGSWTVTASTGGAGSPYAGTLTVNADADLSTLANGDTLTVTLANEAKALSVIVTNSTRYPSTHWRLRVFEDGDPVLDYDDLGMNSANSDYFVRVINNDASNYYIRAEDQAAGVTAAHRPATGWAANDSITYSSDTGYTTLTDSSLALVTNVLKDGYLYPNAADVDPVKAYTKLRIVSNTATTIVLAGDATAATGADATTGDTYFWEAKTELAGGYDGTTPTDSDFIDLLSVDSSPLNVFMAEGMNAGLVDIYLPANTSTAVLSALKTYTEAKGYTGFVDCPSNYNDDQSAYNWYNVEVGRSDNLHTVFPSFAYIPDPDSDANDWVLTSIAGDVAGESAKVAVDYEGYYHPAAGTKKTALGRVQFLPIEWSNVETSAEYLCPNGVNILRKYKGNFVIWGARMLYNTREWIFKHHRQTILHWEHVIAENTVDWVFDLNNPTTWGLIVGQLRDFFKPEYERKGSLDQTLTFEEACVIEANTTTTTQSDMLTGDANVRVKLCLTGIIERLNFYVGKGSATAVPGRLDTQAA